MDALDKDDSQLGQNDAGVAQDFIMLLRLVHSLRLMNYFWNFSYSIFGPRVTETAESETVDKGTMLRMVILN